MSKKEITLDDLAGMVKRGFDNTNERISSAESGLKKEINSVDKKVDSLKKRVDNGFSYVHSRLDLIEKDIRDIRSKLHPAMDKKTYLELEERVTLIEEKMGISY